MPLFFSDFSYEILILLMGYKLRQKMWASKLLNFYASIVKTLKAQVFGPMLITSFIY
jgi:hypothetical protein